MAEDETDYVYSDDEYGSSSPTKLASPGRWVRNRWKEVCDLLNFLLFNCSKIFKQQQQQTTLFFVHVCTVWSLI